MVDLLKKLLKPNPKERLKFAVVIIHPFIKKFPIPPHVSFSLSRSYRQRSSPVLLHKISNNNISKSLFLMNTSEAMRMEKNKE